MSDDLVRRAAALVEKQKAWDKWDNPRQPAPPAMVEGEVATLVSDMAAEITRLRAALATARREGMEEAAKIATEFEIVAHLHGPWSDVPDECAVQASREIAAAIRAEAGEVKAVSDQQIIEALREAAETLSWCARKMKDLCAGRDDVAGVALAAGRAFDAMREVEGRTTGGPRAMSERTTLESLLARVLKGTGPDRELDREIARELFENFGVPDDLPPYTKHRDIIVWCIKRRMEAQGE